MSKKGYLIILIHNSCNIHKSPSNFTDRKRKDGKRSEIEVDHILLVEDRVEDLQKRQEGQMVKREAQSQEIEKEAKRKRKRQK